MNKIYKLLNACLLFMFSIVTLVGCSTNNSTNSQNTTSQSFVGIVIYQNTPNNANWNNIDNFENYILSEISFSNTIPTTNKFLFYIFNNSESFDSNTRFNSTTSSNTLEFDIELLYETTEVYTCFVYKDSDDNYSITSAGFQNIDFSKTNTLAHTTKDNTTYKLSSITNIKVNYSNNLSSTKK